MAPPEKAVTDALRKTVQKIFHSTERANLSVNLVRSRVEDQLALEEGFLKTASWKEKSKSLILAENDRLTELEEEGDDNIKDDPSPVQAKPQPVKKEKSAPSKSGTKRSSTETKSKPRKRPKKEETPESDFKDSDLTPLEDLLDDSEDDYVDKVEEKGGIKSDEDDEKKDVKSKVNVKSESSARHKPKGEPKKEASVSRNIKSSAKKEESDDDDDFKNDVKESKASVLEETKQSVADDSDSDLSSLIDEEPKPKSRKGEPKAKAKVSKPSSSKTKASADLSPDEAEIKLLQSQLVKCGIRKIWGIELKKYGDDNKAKIRHLKSMLREAGIEGRFSEARAREIKEARELAADLEAVTEGNKLWGEGRASRSRGLRKSLKEADSDDEDEEDGYEEGSTRGESEKPVSERIARAKADLAFLGSESESDSD